MSPIPITAGNDKICLNHRDSMAAVGSDRMDSGSGGGGALAAATANPRLDPNAPPRFLSKTYDIVDDPATDDVISWGPRNNSFVVWNQSEFSKDLLPKYFKHSNFSSFVRQLNTYGFKKVDPDKWEFANEGFLRGQKHLLKNIYRRKTSHAHNQAQQPQAQNASISACVEVGKFGLDEEIERLKRDKNVLMQELVRLRQQQQVADNQLQTLGKRFQGMERRQQMMMSFLAKAMQSPGLFAQLVQQNENGNHAVGVNKKRRLPRQSSSNVEDKSAPDGQIIEYRPLDPMATMVAQMLKFDPSRPEPLNNSDDLLVDNLSSPEALDGRSSGSNPGITLAGVPPSMPVSSSYSTASSSPVASEEIQSAAGVADVTMPDAFQDISILSTVPEAVPCEFSEIQGMIPDESVGDIPIENFIVHEHEGIYLNQIATEVDGTIPVEGTVDTLQLSEYIDSLLASEDIIIASPQSVETTEEVVSSAQEAIDLQQAASGSSCINDPLQLSEYIDSLLASEDIIIASPRSVETTEEVVSSAQEAIDMQQAASDSSCNNDRYMDNLTTQMGFLTSDSQG